MWLDFNPGDANAYQTPEARSMAEYAYRVKARQSFLESLLRGQLAAPAGPPQPLPPDPLGVRRMPAAWTQPPMYPAEWWTR